MRIDLNCDLGESFGAWTMGNDVEVIALVSSINIACGFHAGDPLTMHRTLAMAKAHGVSVGAHTALPDLRGFGRRELQISAHELYCDTLYQLGALQAQAKVHGLRVAHLKPHGALYHMVEKQPALAAALVQAIQDLDSSIAVVGLAGGKLVQHASTCGLQVRHEMFADRRYLASGHLVARGEPGAVIDDAELAAAQVLSVANHGFLVSHDGAQVHLRADTVCIHGDRTDAARFTAQLCKILRESGLEIAA